MEKIKRLVKELKDERNKISERRSLWAKSLRDLIHSHLSYYCDQVEEDWHVNTNQSKENHESVYIAFGNVPSGIFDRDQNSHLMLVGGALHFSQIYNGKIFVWIEYPYIEDLLYPKSPYKDLGIVEPKGLDEDAIEKYVEEFIEEIIRSEARDRRLIGFNKNPNPN